MTGWDGTLDAARSVRYVALPVGPSTIVAAVRTSDGSDAPLLRDQRRLRRSDRRLRRHDRGRLPRRAHARPRRVRCQPAADALRRPEHVATAAAEDRDATRALGVRRALARRPHPVRDPVPQCRGRRALQRPRGQPRHRQAGRRRARRQARPGRGDERLALGARSERERRLAAHALREAERHRVRPRARHRPPARVLRRPAVAVELRRRSPPCACRSRAGGRTLVLSKAGMRTARARRHDARSR